jgi:hypothetical protein
MLNGGNALYQPFLGKSFQTSINDGLVQVGFSFEMLSPYTFVCRDLDVTQHKVFLSGQAFSRYNFVFGNCPKD